MSLIKYLLTEQTDTDIVDGIKTYIETQLDINLDNISDEYELLDQGRYAKVFSISSNKDKVIRIEDDLYESFFIDIAGFDDLKNVVRVYYSDIITIKTDNNRDNNIEITIMERLEKVDKYRRQEMEYLENSYGDIGRFVMNEDWRSMAEVDQADLIPVLEDVENGIKELQNNNVYLNDIHSGNIMYDPKTGHYKIIDLSNI